MSHVLSSFQRKSWSVRINPNKLGLVHSLEKVLVRDILLVIAEAYVLESAVVEHVNHASSVVQ